MARSEQGAAKVQYALGVTARLNLFALTASVTFNLYLSTTPFGVGSSSCPCNCALPVPAPATPDGDAGHGARTSRSGRAVGWSLDLCGAEPSASLGLSPVLD